MQTNKTLSNHAVTTATILMMTILPLSIHAALVTHEMVFSGGSPTPTSGSFTYDTTSMQFTFFSIKWNGANINLLPSANSPVTQNNPSAGGTVPYFSQHDLFVALTEGWRLPDGRVLNNTWVVYPPNPPGNVFSSNLALHLFVDNEGVVTGGEYPNPDFTATYTFGTFTVVRKPSTSALSLPDHLPDATDGRQAVKSFQVTPGGQCSFIFSTPDPGSTCLVSWTNNLRQWFPLIQFNTADKGTEVIDTIKDTRKFYRATYLPTGVSAADSFAYPIGNGTVLEQITPEQNDFYPIGTQGIVERPTSAQPSDASKWRNAQDVGSYLMTSKGGGYHPGEDWNLGGGSDDIGEEIRATANGVVIDVSPLNNNSNGGWAIVLRHYLLNGEVMDSVYVHVAPPTLADHSTQNTNGTIGSESWFPFQEGTPVMKGDLIAVVADVDAAFYPDHLHFEMRSKPIEGLPLGAGTAAISKYWANSLGNAYYQSFDAMSKDNIIDPSDFIDDHR